jgi:hypothetical protein
MVETKLSGPAEDLAQALERKAAGCFLCGWIAEDLRANGNFTAAPIAWDREPMFPVRSKILHLVLEDLWYDGLIALAESLRAKMERLKLLHRWPLGLLDEK